MSAYYNEIDPYAAQWLRNLIAAGHIAPGDVDERSIVEVKPEDFRDYSQCHFFAGIGGWSLALRIAGWPDDRPVWTGSCPCQPFSAAGKGQAADDERHLWPSWFSLIRECRPATVFGEQVEAAIGWGWLDAVFTDLEAEGYACGATVLPACSVGAPHIRQRVWFVGQSNSTGLSEGCEAASRNGHGHPAVSADRDDGWSDITWLPCTDGKARPTQSGLFPLAHGIPGRVGRLRAYGNAIVPPLAAEFVKAFLSTQTGD
jgi:DNA (cytosine-5)-methyltransferase 1